MIEDDNDDGDGDGDGDGDDDDDDGDHGDHVDGFKTTFDSKVCRGPGSESLNSTYRFKSAPPGNRTRVARMGILHDTTTPAALWLHKKLSSKY